MAGGEVARRTGARVIQGGAGGGPPEMCGDLERATTWTFHLLDARARAQREAGAEEGGTGETFDWSLLERAALEGPADPP